MHILVSSAYRDPDIQAQSDIGSKAKYVNALEDSAIEMRLKIEPVGGWMAAKIATAGGVLLLLAFAMPALSQQIQQSTGGSLTGGGIEPPGEGVGGGATAPSEGVGGGLLPSGLAGGGLSSSGLTGGGLLPSGAAGGGMSPSGLTGGGINPDSQGSSGGRGAGPIAPNGESYKSLGISGYN